MAFIDDIQSRDTALYPIVEIGVNWNRVAYPYTIRLSTKPVTLFQASGDEWEGIPLNGDWFYSPLLLSSPSIKESIDLENRKYKISNVSLKISNVEYNGERISDNPELKINSYVNIAWISPSIEKYLGAGTETGRNYGYHAYIGVIRDITHDEKTCNITLEDISQSTLHRDVPVVLLSTELDTIPDKYKNKPIPMVYGAVDRSPIVMNHIETGTEWYEEGALSYTMSIDRLPIDSVVHNLSSDAVPYDKVFDENPEGFLYVDTGNSTLRIPYTSKFYEGTPENPYPGQMTDDDVSLGDAGTGEYANVTFSAYYADSVELTAKNPAGDNYIEAEAVRVPVSASAYLIGLSAQGQYDGDESSLSNINLPLSDAFDGLSDTAIEIDRHLVARVYSQNDFKGMAMSFKIDSIGDDNVDETATWVLTSVRMSCYSGDGCTYYVGNFTSENRVAILTGNGGNGVSIDNYFMNPIPETGYTSWDIENNQEGLITSHSQDTEFYSKKVTNWVTPNEGDSIRLYDLTHLGSDYNGLEMSQDIHGVALYQRMLVNDPISRNFFANVRGRTSS